MLRLFTPEEGQQLKDALKKLSDPNIISSFDPLTPSPILRTPTYLPAVLLNLKTTKSLEASVTLGLPLIGRILTEYTEMLNSKTIDPNIPLCFHPIAEAAKTQADCFPTASFTINPTNGDVTLN